MSEKQSFGDTQLGFGMGIAAVVLAFALATALMLFMKKWEPSANCKCQQVEKPKANE